MCADQVCTYVTLFQFFCVQRTCMMNVASVQHTCSQHVEHMQNESNYVRNKCMSNIFVRDGLRSVT